MSDRELFAQHQAAETGVPKAEQGSPSQRPQRKPPTEEGARKKLSDRELFELLQAGKPLPPIEDPTTRDAEASTEERPHRERRERRRRDDAPVDVDPGNVRLWVNLGKADHLDEAGISGALEAMGAPAGKVAKTELRGTFAYVHVAEADVGAFEALAGKQHGEKGLKIERARR
jgi:ATP-dependent RNA helicase DeaD